MKAKTDLFIVDLCYLANPDSLGSMKQLVELHKLLRVLRTGLPFVGGLTLAFRSSSIVGGLTFAFSSSSIGSLTLAFSFSSVGGLTLALSVSSVRCLTVAFGPCFVRVFTLAIRSSSFIGGLILGERRAHPVLRRVDQTDRLRECYLGD